MDSRDSISFFTLIIRSIIAALIVGVTMAVLNFFIEFVKGNPFFGLNEIYFIILWHMVALFIFGGFLGVIYSIYYLFKKKILLKNYISLIYLYVFTAGNSH